MSAGNLHLTILVYNLHPRHIAQAHCALDAVELSPWRKHRLRSSQLSWSYTTSFFMTHQQGAGPAAAHVIVHEGLGGHVGKAGCLEVGGRLARVLQPAGPFTGVMSEIAVPQSEPLVTVVSSAHARPCSSACRRIDTI